MKRFVLFAGITYYASGGWNDFVADFDDLPSAIASGMETMQSDDWRWAHVVDVTTGDIVWEIGK